MRRLLALSVLLVIASCDDVNVHILSGQLYEPQAACLDPSTGIDVVNGGSTGDNCAPQCLSVTSGDATSTYVTTMCPPYPGDYTVEAEDATTGAGDPCTGAFAAYDSADAECPPTLGEGGESDGGVEAGDAGTDAGDDGASASDGGTQDAPGDGAPGD
jgi:hypothetical protein